MVNLAKLSDEELEAKMYELMAARGEAERGYKEQQLAVQAEIDRRAVTKRVEAALEGVPEDQRTAILAELGG